MTTTRTITLPQPALTLLREVLYGIPASREGNVWLVGGTVRDLILGVKEILDFDLALPENPVPAAKEYAHNKKAGFVMLDEEHAVARVLRGLENVTYTIDLAKFRAPTIDDDLKARDFTFNAMAVQLKWPLLEGTLQIHDPLGGFDDLIAKRLVPCSDQVFIDDPLRIMRAFRFVSRFGGSFSPTLLELIKRDAPLLAKVSSERIRDEFFKTLSVTHSAPWVRIMDESGVLSCVLPELTSSHGITQNRWHHLDVFDHTLEALRFFEENLEKGVKVDGWERFQKFLDEPISGGRTHRQLFKLAVLLHDIGKPGCKKVDPVTNKVVFYGHEMEGARLSREIGERLKLSSHETSFLQKVAKNHMRPGVIVQEGINDRRLFRYFTETGRDGVGIALLSLSDRQAAQGPEAVDDLPLFDEGIRQIMGTFYKQMEYARQKPLLTGHDLIAELQLQPGPLFKEILQDVTEAQHLGKVHSHQEALDLARRLLHAHQSGPNPEAKPLET